MKNVDKTSVEDRFSGWKPRVHTSEPPAPLTYGSYTSLRVTIIHSVLVERNKTVYLLNKTSANFKAVSTVACLRLLDMCSVMQGCLHQIRIIPETCILKTAGSSIRNEVWLLFSGTTSKNKAVIPVSTGRKFCCMFLELSVTVIQGALGIVRAFTWMILFNPISILKLQVKGGQGKASGMPEWHLRMWWARRRAGWCGPILAPVWGPFLYFKSSDLGSHDLVFPF